MVTLAGFMLGLVLLGVAFFVYQTFAKKPRTFLEILMGFSTNDMSEEEAEIYEVQKISIKYGVLCKRCGAVIHPRARSTHFAYHTDIDQGLAVGELMSIRDLSMGALDDRAKGLAVEIIKELNRGASHAVPD